MNVNLLSVLALLLLGGCSRNLYVPNNLNTPLFESVGEVKFGVGTKLISPFCVDMQTAYAPLDHFALMINASTLNSGDKESSNAFKHYFAEAGAGVFTALWPDKYNHRRFRLELFGGYGAGRTAIRLDPSFFFNPTSSFLRHQGSYHRKFLQPALGLRGKLLEAAFALRFTEVNFSRYKDFTDGFLTNQGIYNFSVLEPVFTWGVNHRNIRFFGQVGAVLPTQGLDSDYHRANDGGWTYFHLSIGFAFTNFGPNRSRS
jgi:hypothetical protein